MTDQDCIDLTMRLLDAIVASDWQTYEALCADDLTAFEPEAGEHLVQGMGFHKHFFDMADGSPYAGVTTTIASPNVRVMGDVFVIAYTRLTQRVDADGKSETASTQETRIWHRIDGNWKHVHFHRS